MIQAIQTFSPELLLLAQPIRVAFFDVDGVLTDGSLYYGAKGEEVKRFNVLDGLGLKLLLKAGIIPAIITSRDSNAIKSRLSDLGLTMTSFATKNKVEAAKAMLFQLKLDFNEAACMGDDWLDLGLMRSCRICAAPSNAHVEVKNIAHFMCVQAGGHGAARQWCDLLLTAKGVYQTYLEDSL